MSRRARALLTAGLAGFVASQRLRANPYRLYDLLRRLDPVHESALGVWFVSRHADVAAALRNEKLGSDEAAEDKSALRFGRLMRLVGRDAGDSTSSVFLHRFAETMLFRDEPDHGRLRTLVAKAFTPRRMEALAGRVHEIAGEMLDEAAGDGHFDVMRDLAYPLPARVICELLGVPPDDHPLITSAAPALGVGLDPPPLHTRDSIRAADEATRTLVEYLDALIETRRRSPGEDLLSALITAEEDGQHLTTDELISNVLLLLIAGHETTANLIGNGLVALCANPAQLERFRQDDSLDAAVVEELLRYDTPVQMVRRFTLETTEVGGRTIPPGRAVVLLIAAANRDPAVFTDPSTFDISRTPNPHLSFAGGPHFCIGAPLARLEGRIVLGSLVRRFPDLRVVPRSVVRRRSFTVRGFSKLEVTTSAGAR